jgi:hypothetical protein
MEGTGQKERVKIMEPAQNLTTSAMLASGGMVAFLVALALLFVVTGPA